MLNRFFQVSLSTWEQKEPQPSQDFLTYVDSSHASARNPFSEKKWKKFQLSNLFGTSSSAVKLHVVDINLLQSGMMVVDRWLVVLSLGSGQTRNMALDRYYLRNFAHILIVYYSGRLFLV